MRSSELLRRLRRLAKDREAYYEELAGKGSHRKVRFADRQTVVPVHSAELATGTLKAILRQLGLNLEDIED